MARTHNKRYIALKRQRNRNIILNTVCAVFFLAGALWFARFFLNHLRYEMTNNAYVDQYIVPVNIRVSGFIREICFSEHQYVHRGDTLLVLDDREYKIRLQEAVAALMDAENTKEVLHSVVNTARINVAVQDANMAEAQAQLWQTEQDYHRYERLLADEAVSRQQFEQMKASYDASQARFEALKQQRETARSQSDEAAKRAAGADATILHCEAERDMAELNLSYTVVTAPFDGYMGRRSLEEGQYIQAGQSISYLVRENQKWITANYKETQIGNIYLGQKVRIKVDAYKDKKIMGIVTAISEATGSKYALIPTDNSAGNFVKIQQRIPVRIDLVDVEKEDLDLLRAGMMVEVAAIKR
ncbi:MAG TPA: HlyD family secretion protein [Candidatus Tidjanibacter faecipullorum]|uniref:HlyD family secretion protein n=1 Tax=Candidatus Tidjanibacter faecipullorum TaxID=2838766 RepID=A0A9D2DFD6_9BACT|nr:HlyD family secretion protein [Candidatus Tidjanibacter faecipullorum]